MPTRPPPHQKAILCRTFTIKEHPSLHTTLASLLHSLPHSLAYPFIDTLGTARQLHVLLLLLQCTRRVRVLYDIPEGSITHTKYVCIWCYTSTRTFFRKKVDGDGLIALVRCPSAWKNRMRIVYTHTYTWFNGTAVHNRVRAGAPINWSSTTSASAWHFGILRLVQSGILLRVRQGYDDPSTRSRLEYEFASFIYRPGAFHLENRENDSTTRCIGV